MVVRTIVTTTDYEYDAREMNRIEAFSDGVFAIVITLLSFQLNVPQLYEGATNVGLFRALLANWPAHVAFVTSFGSVLIMWMNHHGIFKQVRKPDAWFMFANGFLLLVTTVVPFVTALVSRYLTEGAANLASAAYGGTFVIVSIAYNLLWYVASHERRLLKSNVPDELVAQIRKNLRLAIPIYLCAALLAFINAYLTMGLCLVLWLFWARMDYGGRRPAKPSLS